MNSEGVAFTLWDTCLDSIATITGISRVTSPIRPDLTQDARWQLISHIFVNNAALCHDEDGSILKQLLSHYYPYKNPPFFRHICAIHSKAISRRHRKKGYLGLCHGIELSIVFTDKYQDIHELYLFGNILSRFLTNYASVNSFVDLCFCCQSGEVIHSWQVETEISVTL